MFKKILRLLFNKAFDLDVKVVIEIYSKLQEIEFRQKELHEKMILFQQGLIELQDDTGGKGFKEMVQHAVMSLDGRMDHIAEAVVYTQHQIKDLSSDIEIIELTDIGITPYDRSNN